MGGEEQEEPPACGRNWAELHRDVLMVIFQKIGIMELLGAAGSVCRSWRKVAKEEPELWRQIDMTNHDYGSDAFVLTDPTLLAIDRSGDRLESFSVDYFGDNDLLQYVCDRTSVLKSLCLISCYHCSEEAIAETVKRQPLLEEIQLTFGSYSEKITELVGKECPQLKTLKFNDKWCNLPPEDDEDESADDVEALGIAKTMHQLRHLQLIGNRLTNEGLKAILDGCPHLQTLDIRRCYNVNMDADMRARCARLKTMRLPGDCMDGYRYRADADGTDQEYCFDAEDFYQEFDFRYDYDGDDWKYYDMCRHMFDDDGEDDEWF